MREDSLQQHLGLHQAIEIWYTVDGYKAILTDEMERILEEGQVKDSIESALESLNEMFRYRDDEAD